MLEINYDIKTALPEDRAMDFANMWKAVGGDDNLIFENVKLMEYLGDGGFFTAPASTKYHGAYSGGLYDHSRTVAARLIWLTKQLDLKWQRKESPFIIGMFHDLCKCDQYLKVPDEKTVTVDQWGKPLEELVTSWKYEYNTNTLLKGHGSKSVMILSQFINLTEEEMLCIRYHMGAYEKEEWTEFDAAIRKYETVLWTHQADMLASKVDDI